MIGHNNRLPQTNSENIQKQKHHHITERPFDSLLYSLMTSRTYAISKMVTQINELRDTWLSAAAWRRWCYRYTFM